MIPEDRHISLEPSVKLSLRNLSVIFDSSMKSACCSKNVVIIIIIIIKVLVKAMFYRGEFSQFLVTHMRVRKTAQVFRAWSTRIYGNGCSNIYAFLLVWCFLCRRVCVCRWETKTTFLFHIGRYEPELFNNTLFKYYPYRSCLKH